jgi:exocyst complex component 2
MASEIIRTYTTSLSQFFTLSDLALAEAQSPVRAENQDPPIPPFVPAGTTVITACYWCEKLVDEVGECVSELLGVDVGSEAGTGVKGMMDSLRWRFGEVIGTTWARGISPYEWTFVMS